MCPKPSKVLHSTRLLEEFAARRVMETAWSLYLQSALPTGICRIKGIESIQKVRPHACRYEICIIEQYQSWLKWDQRSGIPINQEDLVFTNLLFSVAIIEGLDQFGINLTDAERRGLFVHTWKMIGLALGISEQLMPDSLEDAHDLYRAIYDMKCVRG